jgi:predicted PurR-regulated permease PerM
MLIPLVTVLLLILILAFLVFRHFLLTFAAAASVALLMGPVQRRVSRALGGRASLAAALLVVMATLTILAPIVGSATVLGRQAVKFLEWLAPRVQPAAIEQLIKETLPERYPWIREWLDEGEVAHVASQAVTRIATGVNRLAQRLVTGFAEALLDLALFLMMLFFLLRDGGHLRAELRRISPFSDAREEQIVEHLTRTVKGVLQSMVVVPLVQGLVALVGFLIFGVPSPVLWALMVVMAALIPLVGSPLAWVPAVGYLYAGGETWRWVGMGLYGVLVISTIDNIVKPIVLRGVARIHPLLGFLAILGGLLSFGPLGFLVGPVIVSLVLSAIRIYRLDVLRAGSERPVEVVVPPAAAASG